MAYPITRMHQRDRRQRPDQIFRSRYMTARVEKNLPDERHAMPKKNGRSCRLRGEQKNVARGIAGKVRWALRGAYRRRDTIEGQWPQYAPVRIFLAKHARDETNKFCLPCRVDKKRVSWTAIVMAPRIVSRVQ